MQGFAAAVDGDKDVEDDDCCGYGFAQEEGSLRSVPSPGHCQFFKEVLVIVMVATV